MGALHEGHASLIKKARKENDIVVVSIFVNPSQFGPNEDYLRYPRPFDKDRKICLKEKVDIIFAPPVREMYPEGYLTYIRAEKMSDILCGKFRPVHFRGVATVVAKLFNIVRPDTAYFGEKDYQQLKIIQRMTEDLNLPVKISPCGIIREPGGLAMSSRNTYLDGTERKNANKIYGAMREVKQLILDGKITGIDKALSHIKKIISEIPKSKIDYISFCRPEDLEEVTRGKIVLPLQLLAAVWIGKTRLIDNIRID